LTGEDPPGIGTVVNGTLTAGLVDIVNGFLAGAGTITGATVDVNGPVSATRYQNATNGGVLLPGGVGSPGMITVNGNVTLYGASFEVVANGAGAAGTNYSQMRSSGTVSLGNSNLEMALLGGYTPQKGDTLTIISAAKVTGTFSQGIRITVRSGNHNYIFTIT